MELNITREHSQEYEFKYQKTSVYKSKKTTAVKSEGTFLLKLDFEEDFYMTFHSKKYVSDAKRKLVFSPIKFKYDFDSNVFLIKNRDFLKIHWNKFKEANRSNKSNTMLYLYEQLYFRIPLGLEYDLLSNGAYFPFFANTYKKHFEIGDIISGMSWVHTPLSLPFKIDYVVESISETEINLYGIIYLDDENLIRLLADKKFQKHAKPYHYSKDFSIVSDIKSIYDVNTGYLKFSNFSLKIFSENEEIDEFVISSVSSKMQN
ncbi:hypothetical protein [Chryseobacterium sp. SIMBA_029]|uniref:hypothetical protein n=1 Tax=Chryseobacterium sp. SIMBA_029 TaxID=3085772 RepID=UPI003978BB5C